MLADILLRHVRALTSGRCPCGAGGTQYQRLSGSLLEGTDRDEQQPWTFNPVRYFWWLMSWMIPGGGMFLEAYFIFRCVRRSLRFNLQHPFGPASHRLL